MRALRAPRLPQGARPCARPVLPAPSQQSTPFACTGLHWPCKLMRTRVRVHRCKVCQEACQGLVRPRSRPAERSRGALLLVLGRQLGPGALRARRLGWKGAQRGRAPQSSGFRLALAGGPVVATGKRAVSSSLRAAAHRICRDRMGQSSIGPHRRGNAEVARRGPLRWPWQRAAQQPPANRSRAAGAKGGTEGPHTAALGVRRLHGRAAHQDARRDAAA